MNGVTSAQTSQTFNLSDVHFLEGEALLLSTEDVIKQSSCSEGDSMSKESLGSKQQFSHETGAILIEDWGNELEGAVFGSLGKTEPTLIESQELPFLKSSSCC